MSRSRPSSRDDALLVAVRGALDVEQVALYDLAGGTELETPSRDG